MILGTAAYMAPEQARGKTVDRRADIWAFVYRNATAMFAVTLVKTASGFDASPPQQLFPISDLQLLNSYALAPDGQRFLFVRSPGSDRVSIVLNWAAHLDELTRSQ